VALPSHGAGAAVRRNGGEIRPGGREVRGKDLAFAYAEGGFQQMQGFTMATLVFRPDAKSKGDPA